MTARRDVLKAAVLAGALPALAAPAIAQERREWKMVTSWPKNFPGLGSSAERIAARITAMSGGRLTVRVLGAGELVPPFEVFDAVAQGTAEMMHSAAYYWQGKNRALSFFTVIPFGLVADEFDAWMAYGGGQELWDDIYARFGLKGFVGGNTGTQAMGWFRREVKTVDDLKGLKFRTAGLGGEVMRRLGVAVVTLSGSELFPSLQSGAIDAAEWVGPWNDLALGLYRLCKYYYLPGPNEPGSALECTVNKAKYDALPKDLQDIVRVACDAERAIGLAEYNAQNVKALDVLVSKHGVTAQPLPPAIATAMGNAAGQVLSELVATDADAARVWQSFSAFRTLSIRNTNLGQGGFFAARDLPYKY